MKIKSIGTGTQLNSTISESLSAVPPEMSVVNALVALTNENSRESIELMLNDIAKIDLIDLSVNRIEKYGFTKVIAKKLFAAVQFALVINKKDEKGSTIRTSYDAAQLFLHLQFEKQEHFVIVGLNVKNQVIFRETIFKGSVNSAVVHPREIVQKLLSKNGIAQFILGHNHPSGSSNPSQQDLDFTERMDQVGKMIGIDLIDHIIIGDQEYTSLNEEGFIS